ncbi:flagellar biosynthesis regulator FlaF [Falsigemmobacter faecalis]|uniref:Flagellar biosynthesis regulatory protein FlaF n=1 Tax=Falsigemmobacter faecalis TaxID=2488730 RepID=A0A3P3D3F1_9RHOB|nr:flagellar biosynthesis regulator FlaF [Falsigemmobacter faecalis]RRH68314.1 flagellar biosynthesis regulatory protein FlaF [Falsigemmobacter faecalis]
MTMHHLARTAYSQPLAPSRSPRSLEYDLLARASQCLRLGWEHRRSDFGRLARAVQDNNALWVTLAADVAEQGNGLPAPLRANLFYLYEFTQHHSRRVLAGDGGVDVLIDVNTAVMRGLRGEPGGCG